MKPVYIISGCAGMTGVELAVTLLTAGHPVIGFDSFFAGSRSAIDSLKSNSNFGFFEYDINNESQMDALFKWVREQFPVKEHQLFFINGAAVVHTKHFYSPDDTFNTNVVAMKKILARCIAEHFFCFINCSTSEVYSASSWQEGGVCENQPIQLYTAEQGLRTSYATGKLLTEHFLLEAVLQGKIMGCSLRFANVYSPDEDHAEHIIPYLISSLLKNKSVQLLENAKNTMRTFLHNRDSCSAIVKLMNHHSALDGTTYNVGTVEEISILKLVEKTAALLQLEDVEVTFSGQRSLDPKRRLLNVDKIKKACAWEPRVSLDEGLAECVRAKQKPGKL